MPCEACNLLNVASKNCERLILLINDILDIEKISSGKLEFNFELIDLVLVAKKYIETNCHFASEKKVVIKLIEFPQSAKTIADEHRILQAFNNLLSNAVKFSEYSANIEVSIYNVNNNYKVTVKDFGRGIPASFREKIFSKFSQVDASDTKDHGGTGLGLNISKMIINRHNGTIDYKSTPQVETIFFFELPIVD